MIIHRDIGSSYHHKSKVQGVDYSPFIMETAEKLLEKMETTPVAPRRSFPPPICNSRFLFLCFCGTPSRERRGAIFIAGFRSKPSRWRKDRRQWSSDAQKRVAHAAKESGRVGPTIWSLEAPLPSIFSPTTPS